MEDIIKGDGDKFKSIIQGARAKLSTKHFVPVDNTKQYPDDPNHYVTAQTNPKQDLAVKVDNFRTKVEIKSPIQRQTLPKRKDLGGFPSAISPILPRLPESLLFNTG